MLRIVVSHGYYVLLFPYGSRPASPVFCTEIIVGSVGLFINRSVGGVTKGVHDETICNASIDIFSILPNHRCNAFLFIVIS